MVTIRSEIEAFGPYPTVSHDLSADLSADVVWQRIEAWVNWRWSPREVVWLVEGCGEFVPPLHPATVTSVEFWSDEAYAPDVTRSGPLGGVLLTAAGVYRIKATVGAGPVPAAVESAFARLYDYFLACGAEEYEGARSYSLTAVSGAAKRVSRHAEWKARALELSGAADLLRPWAGKAGYHV